MIPRLEDYRPIVGDEAIAQLRRSAAPLRGKHVVHVSATSSGGGVAEILNTLVFLMNDAGINTGWRVLIGSHSFFEVTKGIHNSLQGGRWQLNAERRRIYREYCERNAIINHIRQHDAVIVHDPQPLGMIADYEVATRWIWRCHIDLSEPSPSTMRFLLPYIRRYHDVIVSSERFRIKGLACPQHVIRPSIDPLSPKNIELTQPQRRRILRAAGVPMDKPLIVQVSRFDPWKGHLSLLDMFEAIRREADCTLVLIGDMAGDDPQGPLMYRRIRERAAQMEGVHIITEKNDLLVNALQREAAFVFQNSVREGFGLTVSEALWKGTPVLATPVGGIPLQVLHDQTGYLIRNRQEGVSYALRLLGDRELRKRLGETGREHVRQNFLITRHLQDYIDLLNGALAAAAPQSAAREKAGARARTTRTSK